MSILIAIILFLVVVGLIDGYTLMIFLWDIVRVMVIAGLIYVTFV